METFEFYSRFTKYTRQLQWMASKHTTSADEARTIYLEVVYRAFKEKPVHQSEKEFKNWLMGITSTVMGTQAVA